jgi:aspartate/methionine/tyrosine aminotransferase
VTRQIPASGINLFQLIYVLIREYAEKTGQAPMNLSLGNPDGIPVEALRKLKAKFAEDPGYDYHTYAEDKNLHSFAEGMVALHSGVKVSEHPHLKAVPTAGIKTAGALLPLACGLHLPDAERRKSFTVASNLPAYDIIGTWSQGYLGGKRIVWPLASSDNMRLNLTLLDAELKKQGLSRVDMVYVIRPGNPAAVGASAADWEALADWCLKRKTRLVNDAAYGALAAKGKHVSLAEVARDHKQLEWIELYSVSKSFNDPGARLGALAGSKDFVDDYLLIKGNTDSGPVPSVMAAYGEFFKDAKAAGKALDELRGLYERRLSYVVAELKKAGLKPACDTDAGFFTLWKVPKKAYGKPLPKEWPPHEAFNRLVIGESGIVGVHFEALEDGAKVPLIRYAVCADVLAPEFKKRFERELARLKPEY